MRGLPSCSPLHTTSTEAVRFAAAAAADDSQLLSLPVQTICLLIELCVLLLCPDPGLSQLQRLPAGCALSPTRITAIGGRQQLNERVSRRVSRFASALQKREGDACIQQPSASPNAMVGQ
eukprot:3898824-Rhodomonas_salina.1